MIRPRIDSAYHDYKLVFSDLRSGRLSTEEYELMCAEDLLETARRQEQVARNREQSSGILAMARLTPEQETEINNEAKAYVPEVIRDESSGAY